jgi:hypothetical protein
MAPGTRRRTGRWGWIQAQAGQADDSNGLVTWNHLRKRRRSPKRLLGRPRMRSEALSRRVTQTGMGTARQRRWSELWTSTGGQLAVRALPNKGSVLQRPTGFERGPPTSVCAGQRGMWSPPPESNRRPHPYHGTTRNRCAKRRFPRSRPTVGAKVKRSLEAQLCVLLCIARSPTSR